MTYYIPFILSNLVFLFDIQKMHNKAIKNTTADKIILFFFSIIHIDNQTPPLALYT